MKRVFMCVNMVSYNKALGITKKVIDQRDAFIALGYDVWYSGYLENGTAIFDAEGNIIDTRVYSKIIPQKIRKLIRRFVLMKHCADFINHNKFDIGFIRWDAVDHFFLKVLKCLKAKCPIVIMDFHGYFPGYSPREIKGKYIKKTTKLNGNKMERFVDIGLTESNNDNLFGITCIKIDTGVDVNKYNKHEYMGDENVFNLISVSNEAIYHGFDRLINGIKMYIDNRNQKNVFFHIVGNITDETRLLVKKLQLEEQVFFYGYKTGKELQDIYSKCNIGVGPLAPHRVGGKEGTGIKTKEYFAMGIPYFYAGHELLVPSNYPYVFQITDNEEFVKVSDVIEWFVAIRNDKCISDHMREFARIHYSWEKIFNEAIKQVENRRISI